MTGGVSAVLVSQLVLQQGWMNEWMKRSVNHDMLWCCDHDFMILWSGMALGMIILWYIILIHGSMVQKLKTPVLKARSKSSSVSVHADPFQTGKANGRHAHDLDITVLSLLRQLTAQTNDISYTPLRSYFYNQAGHEESVIGSEVGSRIRRNLKILIFIITQFVWIHLSFKFGFVVVILRIIESIAWRSTWGNK